MAGSKKNIKEGDEVAWNWGAGAPGGTAVKVKEQEPVEMETKRGNTVKKKGEPGNPAVYIKRSGHDVVKKASELKVQKEGPKQGKDENNGDTNKEEKDGRDNEEDKGEGPVQQTGEKRKAAEPMENGAKKQKSKSTERANQSKKQTKKSDSKTTAATNGQPRRSGRLAAASK